MDNELHYRCDHRRATLLPIPITLQYIGDSGRLYLARRQSRRAPEAQRDSARLLPRESIPMRQSWISDAALEEFLARSFGVGGSESRSMRTLFALRVTLE
jgi:hypothetical protein